MLKPITYITAAAAIVCSGWTITHPASAAYNPAPRSIVAAAQKETAPPRGTPAKRAWVICRYFKKGQCRPALNIAWCESTLRPWAANGQYLGTFQMGAAERRRFGHGRSVWAQAKAAKKYHAVSGWHPWSCQP